MSQFTNINNDFSIERDLKKFNGFYSNPFRDSATTGFGFIFMTRPMLFLTPSPKKGNNLSELAYENTVKESSFVPFILTEAGNSADKVLINMLSYDQSSFESSFMPVFTNECKGFSTNDVSLDQTNVFSTKQGFNQVLPTHASASRAPSQVGIQVQEDSNLTFTKIMKLWVEYIEYITDGTFSANPEMVRDGIIDYTSSIYYFLLEPDGKTIKYWAKYTGCWPTNIPYGSFNYTKGDVQTIDLSLNFNYMTKEDMNPKILEDFNKVSLKMTDKLFEDDAEYSYAPYSKSVLLNLEKMKEQLPEVLTTLNSDIRDPLIVYVDGTNSGTNVDTTKRHFELVFDTETYKNIFESDVLDLTQYYLNDSGANITKDEISSYWD